MTTLRTEGRTRMRIAVYGASGYQGRLVAAELRRRGIVAVLVGRSTDRLRSAADEIGMPDAELRAGNLDDPDQLAAAFRDCGAVINCAGPFTLWGERVVRAAVAAGCHYADTAGEQFYIKRVFDTFAEPAERAGVTVVPAMTDGGVGGLIAQLAADRAAPVDELTIAHRAGGGGLSRGSARTALENLELLGSGGLTYQDGRWRPDAPARRTSLTFPGSAGAVPMVRFALPEVVIVPRHVRARRVEGLVEAELSGALTAVTPELVDGMPEGPPEDQRRAGRFTIVADAAGGDGRRARGVVQGYDTYGTTAVIAAEGARRLVAEGSPAGVLGLAQACDPAGFLDFLAPHGVRWSVEVDEPQRAT